MRAREPDLAGRIDRDGVRIGYESFGHGERTVVFAPMDQIVESRAWKAQVPYLARHARVVTIDSRGNGRSDRPDDPAAYSDLLLSDDLIAVLDELGIDSAVLVGICTSSWVATTVAIQQPERVRGLVMIAPWLPFVTPPLPFRAEYDFEADYPDPEGWAKCTRAHLERDWRDFCEFFFTQLLPEPHSTKQFDDCLSWAMQTSGRIQNHSHDAPLSVTTAQDVYDRLDAVRCPVLVVHGSEDRCQPAARAELIAERTGGERLQIDGAGHLPMAREPVAVNLAVKGFLDRVWPDGRARCWTAPHRRQRRVLYLSSPIGLGHGRRDLAIVDELRKQRPEVVVDWLAQPPLTAWLQRSGESVHPASAWLARESDHIDALAGEHDLHAFQAIRKMDEILVANFMVFQDVVENEQYDLWVGDESWELDHFLFENPELKRSAYAWLTDFVGWVPMHDGRESELTADYNAEMLDHVARLPRIRDRAVFVGEPEDVVDLPFGPGLPAIAQWTREHYSFAGYVTGFLPAEIADRDELRARFGYGDAPVCVVAVGGSGAGRHLLQRAVAAYPAAAARCPGLRMHVVTGPRIDPAELPTVPGVEVHGWLPDLHRRLAAADVALVQGGLTTTMELTAAGTPFVYVPLRNHFEQNVHVRHRLERYRAGRCVTWDEASPERLAAELAALVGRPTDFRPVDPGGAARAAALLAELL